MDSLDRHDGHNIGPPSLEQSRLEEMSVSLLDQHPTLMRKRDDSTVTLISMIQ